MPDAAPKPQPQTPAAPQPAPQPDFLSTLMEEPLYLAAGAVVVLGGIGFILVRRRRAAERGWPDDDEDSGDKIAPTFSGDTLPEEKGTEDLAQAPEPSIPRKPEERPRPAPADATAGIVAALASARAESAGDDNDLDFHAPTEGASAGERNPQPAPTTEVAAAREKTPTAARVDPLQNRTPQPARPRPADAASAGQPAGSAVPDFLMNPQPGAPANDERVQNADAAPRKLDFDLDPLPQINTQLPSTGPRPNLDFKLDLDDLDLNAPPQRTSGDAARDDHWHDVQQKFDLAKAYEDMGDKQGARDILQEVIREGDTTQQVQARRRLESLS
jgi:pilus assembly protein FimV